MNKKHIRILAFCMAMIITTSVCIRFRSVKAYAFVGTAAIFESIAFGIMSGYVFSQVDQAQRDAGVEAQLWEAFDTYMEEHTTEEERQRNMELLAPVLEAAGNINNVVRAANSGDIDKLNAAVSPLLTDFIITKLSEFCNEELDYDEETGTYSYKVTDNTIDSGIVSVEDFYNIFNAYWRECYDLSEDLTFRNYSTILNQSIDSNGQYVTILYCLTSSGERCMVAAFCANEFLIVHDDVTDRYGYKATNAGIVQRYLANGTYSGVGSNGAGMYTTYRVQGYYKVVSDGSQTEQQEEKEVYGPIPDTDGIISDYTNAISKFRDTYAEDVTYHKSDSIPETVKEVAVTLPGTVETGEDDEEVFVPYTPVQLLNKGFTASLDDIFSKPAVKDKAPTADTITNTVTGSVSVTNVGAIASSIAGTYGDGEFKFDNFKVTRDLTTVFPFCIPFDIKRIVMCFKTTAQCPVFRFDFSQYYPFNLISNKADAVFELDMSQFDVFIKVEKFFVIMGYVMFLVSKTRDWIKG